MISVRLNPNYAEERAALIVFDEQIDLGFEARDVITNAILAASGHTPEMFHKERSDAVVVALEEQLMHLDLKGLNEKIDAIYDLISNQIVDFLKNVRSADPERFKEFANQDESNELDDQFIRNAQQAAKKTFRQRGK